MRVGADAPELAAAARKEVGARTMGRIITAALAVVGSGAGATPARAAAGELVREDGLDRDLADRFVSDFGPHIAAMATAIDKADAWEDVPDLFAEEFRRRRLEGGGP